MTRRCVLAAATALLAAAGAPLVAQPVLTPTAAPAEAASAVLAQGTPLVLVTTARLTSGETRTGQQIAMRVKDDVRADGLLVIPAGSDAVGVVAEARDTGGLAVNGRLLIAPLYVAIGGETVRLIGGGLHQGKTRSDAVVGMIFTGLISGRKAVIAPGTELAARVLRDVRLPAATRP